ncbi:hypothetical protein JRC04_16095 [Mycolicibacterium sp. S2-37]|uniref:hypothetical protein n=1 Tax=Mycolicibacterium sp. S2-37 TaxID=2810297 RepID=UPI001A94BDEF|nr:hypothetical protein [Mycolicibacterium sp. S2-37]MBO0678989.1 hypothetical protein [Mycolicibacterium sp. S2-37]
MSVPSSCHLLASWLDNRAICGCGHTGKRRLLRATAAIDVATHCQQSGHSPMTWSDAVPEVIFS